MSRSAIPVRMSLEQVTRNAQRAHRRFMQASARSVDVVHQVAPPIATRNQYKGAEYSRIYSDWLAGLLSPDDEIRGDIRQLRARARDLARNNPYAGAYLELLGTNVIGPHGMGLKAQVRDRRGELDTQTNDTIEEAWWEYWSGPVTIDGELSGVEFEEILIESAARDGDIFARRYLGADLPHGLALQAIDGDLVDDSYNLLGARAEPEVRMGIEVDPRGRRMAYYVLDIPYLPGGQGRGRMRIPADEMLHLYRPKRANQARGVTWLARVMTTLKNVDRYAENELIASATGAAKMGFLQWRETALGGGLPTDPAVSQSTDKDDGAPGARVSMEAEPGSIEELPPGMEFKEWNPQHPSTAYDPFVKNALRSVATGLGVTYAALTGDISDANYSNMRFGAILERAVWSRLQQWWIRAFRQPVFEWWLQAAILSGRLQLPSADWRLYRNALWLPRSWPWVDPQKDAQASRELLGLGLTSRTRLLAGPRADQDATFEEILEELAHEAEEAQRLKVDIGGPATVRELRPPPPGDAAVGDAGAGGDGSGGAGADGAGGAGAGGDAAAARSAMPEALRARAGVLNGAGH